MLRKFVAVFGQAVAFSLLVPLVAAFVITATFTIWAISQSLPKVEISAVLLGSLGGAIAITRMGQEYLARRLSPALGQHDMYGIKFAERVNEAGRIVTDAYCPIHSQIRLGIRYRESPDILYDFDSGASLTDGRAYIHCVVGHEVSLQEGVTARQALNDVRRMIESKKPRR